MNRIFRDAPSMMVLALLLLAVAIGGAPSAGAGTARVVSLGEGVDYLDDPAGITRWYAGLVGAADQVFLELGDVAHGRRHTLAGRPLVGHGGGGQLRLDERGRWGTLGIWFEDHLARDDTDGAFAMRWGRALGAWDLAVGGRFTTSGQSRAGTALDDRIDSEYQHQYELGLAGPVHERVRLELAGEIVNTLFETSGALYRLQEKDWGTFGLRARARVVVDDRLTLTPVLAYARILRGDESEIIGGPARRDAWQTRAGLGAELAPRRGTRVIVSGEYRALADTWRLVGDPIGAVAWERSDRDGYQLHTRLGVETRLRPWLALRAGARYVRVHEEIVREFTPEQVLERRDLEAVATPLFVGVGIRHAGVAFDLAYSDTAPINDGLQGEGVFAGEGPGFAAATLSWEF